MENTVNVNNKCRVTLTKSGAACLNKFNKDYIDEYIGYQCGLGTPEALNTAVTDGDAVFVYRDDLLNFTKFVQEKLGVTVE